MGDVVAGPQVVARVVDPIPADDLVGAQAWARANGLEPNDVRVGAGCPVEILADDTIRWRRNVLSAEGKVQWDPATRNELLTEVVVSPLLVPLPAHLADPG